MATAVSDFGALAQNLAETLQYVWQVQEGCRVECYGVNESQSLSQRQTTTQSATATGRAFPTSAGSPTDGLSFFSWVTAFARNIGATVQWIFQLQEASCLEHCGEEALLQAAGQRAATDQTSTAGDVPEPVSEPPAGPAQPVAASQPSAAEEPPPSDAPRASMSVTAAASSASSSASTAAAPPRSRWIAAEADGPSSKQPSDRQSLHSSIAAAGGPAAGEPPAAESGPDVGPSAHTGQRTTPRSTSATQSRTSTANPVAPAPITLDRSAATDAGNDPAIPWLPTALLLVAGLAVLQSLRVRPGFRA
jgi:hypothetical protein